MNLLIAALLLCCSVLLTLAQSEPQVAVLNGTYEGVHLPSFNQDAFLGIPYAQDAGGQNRFRIPQALNETWSDIRSAKNYSHACPDNNPTSDAIYGMSENCLSINLVRPAGLDSNIKLPVMLWIHGGSYQVGTSGLARYNLSYIVERSVDIGRPIIGASINYRKGGWGNMYSIEIQGTGNTNIALRDMRQALAWISENLAAFGGDPDTVTIWGESSGSFAVGQLLLSYGGRTDGLFHRSIQESGSAATAWYNGTEWYQPIYDDIVSNVNCSDAVDTLACLRTVPYDVIYPYLNSSTLINGGPGWYPTVDGDIVPMFPTKTLHSGKFASSVPHLYGSNTDEGTDNAPPNGIINTDEDLFSYLLNNTGFALPEFAVRRIMELYPDDPAVGIPANTGTRFDEHGYQYKRIAAILGDAFYHATRLDDARSYTEFASGDSKTYTYRFNTRAWVNGTNATYTDTIGGFAPEYKGVAHASEIAFVFNNPEWVGPWAGYTELKNLMSELWINFAYDGNPNGAFNRSYAVGAATDAVPQTLDTVNVTGLERPFWPAYDEDSRGLNLVLQTQGQGGCYIETDTYRLDGREYLSQWARRRHV
ncbi:hypothetical protein OHC33_005733 [Knufia fluminis]|uniref:Carboxylic ester hydrolase n=1 Tax=Knufia fluminis TaxID=191047 RepID=A0AAN8I8L0_9EURO|nr:hypothetical protein OHC33_005733 [Knufia fluminis]